MAYNTHQINLTFPPVSPSQGS